MVVVTTPNKIRICLEPKDLNTAVFRPKYQLPTLDELLPKLSRAKVLSTLDAKDGFYQVGLDENSSLKRTFWTLSWPEIHFIFACGTANRNAGSREDVAHVSIEHFDCEYCVLDLKIGRDGLQKIA